MRISKIIVIGLAVVFSLTSCKSQDLEGCYKKVPPGKDGQWNNVIITKDSIMTFEGIYMSNGTRTYKGKKSKKGASLYLDNFNAYQDSIYYSDSVMSMNLNNGEKDSFSFEFVFFTKSSEWPIDKFNVKITKNGKAFAKYITRADGKYFLKIPKNSKDKYLLKYGNYSYGERTFDLDRYKDMRVNFYLPVSREADVSYARPIKEIAIKQKGDKLMIDGYTFEKIDCKDIRRK